MRRVQSACLEQTLHFSVRDSLSPEETNRLVRTEVEQYKTELDRKCIRYKIEGERILEDGSIILRIRKQYNAHDCGDYLD